MFRRAERRKAYLKIALCGVSGSGKTYSSLLLAKGLGNKVAMIDTENGSGEMYSHLYKYDVCPVDPPFTPKKYIEAIQEAESLGYDVLIIDSFSHAWSGQGGILEMVDKKAAASRSKNSFTAWRDVTPEHNRLVDTILHSKMHIITCMRSKTAYEMQDDGTGKKTPVKVGLAPIQREGVEYEFTIVFDISVEKHLAIASKDRTGLFNDFIDRLTPDVGQQIKEWAESGADITENKFVRLTEDGHCFVRRRTGFTDIELLDDEMLGKMLDTPSYELAHKAISELLNSRKAAQSKVESDNPQVQEASADEASEAFVDAENLPLSDDMFKDDAIDK